MALKELIGLADDMAKPYIDDPRFTTSRLCMPDLECTVNEIKGFIHDLKLEILQSMTGDVLRHAQSDLEDDSYSLGMTWTSSGQVVEEMKRCIAFWQDSGHVGIAHVLQTRLFLGYPEMAVYQAESFTHCRGQFLDETTRLLEKYGRNIPSCFHGSQLYLPSQLAQVPAIAAHFAQRGLPDCLGRTTAHLLTDAGSSPRWESTYINRYDILGRTACISLVETVTRLVPQNSYRTTQA